MPLAIGIDLGTVYSCLAIYRYGNVDILANNQGNNTTPSVVAFNTTDRLVGAAAKNQISLNSENTIYGESNQLVQLDFQLSSKVFHFLRC